MPIVNYRIRYPVDKEFKVDIKVTEKGWFYANLPDEFAELCADAGIRLGYNGRAKVKYCKVDDDTFAGLKS